MIKRFYNSFQIENYYLMPEKKQDCIGTIIKQKYSTYDIIVLIIQCKYNTAPCYTYAKILQILSQVKNKDEIKLWKNSMAKIREFYLYVYYVYTYIMV